MATRKIWIFEEIHNHHNAEFQKLIERLFYHQVEDFLCMEKVEDYQEADNG